MASSFVNYQVRSEDAAAVALAAVQLVKGTGYVSPVDNGWVTLLDQQSESQDAYEIGRIGADLSATLGTLVIAFVMAEGSMLVYYLFDNGDLLDEYSSMPTRTSEGAEEGQSTRHDGRPEIWMNYTVEGVSRSTVEAALIKTEVLKDGTFATSVAAEGRVRALATATGMDPLRAVLGFSEFERKRPPVADAAAYQKIDGRRRPVTRRVPPPIPPRK